MWLLLLQQQHIMLHLSEIFFSCSFKCCNANIYAIAVTAIQCRPRPSQNHSHTPHIHTHTWCMETVYMRFVCVICNAKPNDLGRFVYVQFFAVNDLGEFIRRPYLSRSSTYSAFVSEYENKKLHTLIVATVSHISFLIATRHFRYWCIVVVVVVVVVRESDRIEKFAIHETTAEHSVRHIRRELIFIKQS